ncbi:uncharacterized protein LOC135498758 isoform X3 [Lineus longissimus]|uniref:uncharacterized protein LOC135498758 isoform X3 n=1 Tax=Lineus longissimus TaxID=88925 RepID=UPI002B4F08F3
MTAIVVMSARPAPRVKAEAEMYYVRNQGSLGSVLDHSKNKTYASPRPVPKCPTSEAQEQYEKHKGKMGLFLNHSNNKGYNSARPAPRCPTPEAKAQYEKHRGCMSSMIGSGAEYKGRVQDRVLAPRAVRPEAQGIAKMNKGLATKNLFQNYGKLPQSSRPIPRIKPEADDNMKKNKGCMDNLLGNYGKLPQSARPAERVKPEASGNAALNRGGRAKMMLSMAPPSHRSARGRPSQKNVSSSCIF